MLQTWDSKKQALSSVLMRVSKLMTILWPQTKMSLPLEIAAAKFRSPTIVTFKEGQSSIMLYCSKALSIALFLCPGRFTQILRSRMLASMSMNWKTKVFRIHFILNPTASSIEQSATPKKVWSKWWLRKTPPKSSVQQLLGVQLATWLASSQWLLSTNLTCQTLVVL